MCIGWMDEDNERIFHYICIHETNQQTNNNKKDNENKMKIILKILCFSVIHHYDVIERMPYGPLVCQRFLLYKYITAFLSSIQYASDDIRISIFR